MCLSSLWETKKKLIQGLADEFENGLICHTLNQAGAVIANGQSIIQ
jgi:hypothetical protein